MVCMRSGKQTGEDREFHRRCHPLRIDGVMELDLRNYIMRVRPYKDARKQNWPRYVAMVEDVLSFYGEGATPLEAVEDACTKLRFFIEEMLKANQEPRNWRTEKDESGRFRFETLIDEECPECTWMGKPDPDMEIKAYVQKGCVVILEWNFARKEECYLWMDCFRLGISTIEELNLLTC